MNKDVQITVELTYNEAMALAGGVRFIHQPGLAAKARHKVLDRLEQAILPHTSPIHYHSLEA